MPSPGPGVWPIVRKHTRFLIDLRLVVKAGGTALHGRTNNLSEGGVGATVAGEIAMGELVGLEFRLPIENSKSTHAITVEATVSYRQGFQYGFQFTDATDEQVKMIRRATRYLPLAPIRTE
jgi:hypothetical protein